MGGTALSEAPDSSLRFFCPCDTPPAPEECDPDSHYEKRLSQRDSTAFTFANYYVSGDALNRWLYCRILDNTCRELGIALGMTDVELVEALRVRRLPFETVIPGAPDFDFFRAEPDDIPLPETHPTGEGETLVAFYWNLLKKSSVRNMASEQAGLGIFDEMGITSTCHDWRVTDEDPDGFYENIRKEYARLDPRLVDSMNRAMAFVRGHLIPCIVVAAYLNRFVDRVDHALVSR